MSPPQKAKETDPQSYLEKFIDKWGETIYKMRDPTYWQPVPGEICTAKLDKEREPAEEKRLRSRQRRRKPRKASSNQPPHPLAGTPPPPSPSWPRPGLTEPTWSAVAKAPTELATIQLPPKVYTITQTTFARGATPRTLCLCTTFSAAIIFLSHLAEDMAHRPVFYVLAGAKRALKTYRVIRTYAGKEGGEFGFEARVEERGEVVVDVKAKLEEGEMWQGKMGGGKVFGEGFGEVTVESVKAVVKK
jgi:hypothetical protein